MDYQRPGHAWATTIATAPPARLTGAALLLTQDGIPTNRVGTRLVIAPSNMVDIGSAGGSSIRFLVGAGKNQLRSGSCTRSGRRSTQSPHWRSLDAV